MTSLTTTPIDEIVALLRTRLDPVTDATAAGGAPVVVRSDYDLNGGGPGMLGRELAPAAVLAPLIERDGELMFVLTERAGHLKRHAGQVSFPGGRVDAVDPNLAATSLREAHEEIGLAPSQVELIGSFDAYETVTGFAVTPFVGLVRGPFTPVPDPDEVADVFEAPFAFLMNPVNHRRAWREWNGERRYFYDMTYQDRHIWGATAGMLKCLYDRLYGDAS